jgi:methanogenic corrinoid protein MtbC1
MVEAVERYIAAALAGDRSRAAGIVADLLIEDHAPAELIETLLCAAQEEIGLRWELGACSVCDEHTVTAVTDAILSSLTVGFEPPSTRGHLVLTCADGEWHGLPARFAAELLTLQGFRVTYLGTAVPVHHLRRYLADVDADAVAVSCTMTSNLVGAARTIRVARQMGFQVLTGGGAFGTTPKRSRLVGANHWVPAPQADLDLASVSWPSPIVPDLEESWAYIDQEHTTLVRVAMTWLVQASIDSSELDLVLDDLVDDINLALHVAASASLCRDDAIIVDHLRWLRRLETSGLRPRDTGLWAGLAVAHALAPLSPSLAEVLEGAVADA